MEGEKEKGERRAVPLHFFHPLITIPARTHPIHRAFAPLIPFPHTHDNSLYGSPIPGHVLAERLASFVHAFNLYWYVRPFGSTALLATFDVAAEEAVGSLDGPAAAAAAGGAAAASSATGGPALYAIDPSGAAHRYYGTAVGKGRQAAKTAIERLNLGAGGLTCAQGMVEVAKM